MLSRSAGAILKFLIIFEQGPLQSMSLVLASICMHTLSLLAGGTRPGVGQLPSNLLETGDIRGPWGIQGSHLSRGMWDSARLPAVRD